MTSADPTTKPAPPKGSVFNDLKILWHMAVTGGRGKTHEERLENFYSGQASGYDAFRKRLLHGREELFASLPTVPGGVWVDLGAGTGENAENWGERLKDFSHAYLVDLSSSLLKVAEQRVAARGWTNVTPVHADATQFLPPALDPSSRAPRPTGNPSSDANNPTALADIVTFSYSLTMIPDWFLAMDQALRMLKPGGLIGVVDFFVARKWPADGLAKHHWSTRTMWPTWFANDNVFLNGDHIPYLQSRFETVSLKQHRGKVPYMPFVRAPYYQFVGRKPVETPGV